MVLVLSTVEQKRKRRSTTNVLRWKKSRNVRNLLTQRTQTHLPPPTLPRHPKPLRLPRPLRTPIRRDWPSPLTAVKATPLQKGSTSDLLPVSDTSCWCYSAITVWLLTPLPRTHSFVLHPYLAHLAYRYRFLWLAEHLTQPITRRSKARLWLLRSRYEWPPGDLGVSWILLDILD